MTMARSEQKIAKAIAESDAWMDAVEPARLSTDAVDDRKDLRQIGVAMLAIEAAEQSLVAAVAQAKAGGRSWTDIANVLGVSRQAARQRFDPLMESARRLHGPLQIASQSHESPGDFGLPAEYCDELAAFIRRRITELPQDSGGRYPGSLLYLDADMTMWAIPHSRDLWRWFTASTPSAESTQHDESSLP
jgi:hypothetical protein